MKNYNVVINHIGSIDLRTIEEILYHIKIFLENDQLDKLIRKRIYSLSIECLENIFKHSDLCDGGEHLEKNYPSRFIIEKIADSFLIHTGNIILNDHIRFVIERLDKLNQLTQKEINTLYKKSLSDAKISLKGGAGLGLIVMAKTTGEKIKYDFEKINDKFSYFAMQLNLKNNIQ